MKLSHQYRPVKFFGVTFLSTWIPWFIAVYLSYQNGMSMFELPFIFAGMFAPFIVAIFMIYGSKDKGLISDFWDRLRLHRLNLRFLPLLLLIMPVALFVATTISVVLGESTDQFALSSNFRVIQGQSMVGLVILFLAPLMEELGWRGYGVDSLRSRLNLFQTTMVFAGLWALWHVPLFFINGYYHNGLSELIHVANFFLSILPATILLNWVYYKNDRSILAAFLLHLMMNLSAVLFQTTQFTKCIITILLLIVSTIIIARNRDFFWRQKE